jgi:hypothetical protein
MKKTVLFILIAAMTGCTKVPDRLYNPTAVFKSEVRDNEIQYTMYLKGIILNDHPETVLKNIRGTITIRNKQQDITLLPFEVPQLLPLQKFTINAEKSGTERDMAQLFALFQINPGQMVANEGEQAAFTTEHPVRSDSINFEISSYEKENIFDIIKGKKDENK